MCPTVADDRTEVGSYFIANYPSFSVWSQDAVEADVRPALAALPADVPLELYLHIPFCRKRCHFCYSRVYTDKNAKPRALKSRKPKAVQPIGEHTYHRRVQYKENDASGIVHCSSFFLYAEEAEHAMWRAAGLSVEPQETEIGWPRVSASFDFFKPLRFEDEIDVRIRLVGRTAKTFRYQSVIEVRGDVAAIGTSTSICVRKVAGEPLKAVDIPLEIAERFEMLPPVDRPRRTPVSSHAP